ncbi:MAG: secretin and TonB N-terminal domain-containing protein, partial [Candidatus Omnitrophica bacterium]|nr:secretin and TonB N-terminal domain-containing protein [Candidatus Omnitrophota bacterium]
MKRLAVIGLLCILFYSIGFAQQQTTVEDSQQQTENESTVAEVTPPAGPDFLQKAERVTLDFKDADIRNVLKIISHKTGINIVTTPEVIGNVTIRLVDVPWEKALDAILKMHGFGYDKQANIIMVAPIEKLTAQKKQEAELAQIQPTVTEVFQLKYIDAQDAKKAIEPQLSSRGKVTILETTGQAGWEFGSGELGKRKRVMEGRVSRSKTLIVSDVPPVLEKVRDVIQKIDISPQQILIEARLVEVNHDKLKEIGVNWGTGIDGPTSLTSHRDIASYYIETTNSSGELTQKEFKRIVELPMIDLDSKNTKIFGAQSLPAVEIGEFFFQKISGTKLESLIKVLETKGDANVLSAPHIMTINNQEASILIGEKFPLLKAVVSTETGNITGQS